MKPERILVDIDYKADSREKMKKIAEDFAVKMYYTSKILGLEFTDMEVYETAKGFHIYLDAESKRPLTPVEIIIIQLALGSDYKRELFNLRRARVWLDGEDLDPNWNVLYKYKYNHGRLASNELDTEYSRIFKNHAFNTYREKMRGEG